MLKVYEVKTPKSLKTFLLQLVGPCGRTISDLLVEVMDDIIYISPDTDDASNAEKDFGNYRKYQLEPTRKLTIKDVEDVCKEIGVLFDNFDKMNDSL